MEMRDIKFPKPKKPNSKRREMEERIRPFAAPQDAPRQIPISPRQSIPKRIIWAIMGLAVLAVVTLAYLSLPALNSISRLRVFLGQSSRATSSSSFSKFVTLLQNGGSSLGGLKELSLSGGKLLKTADSLRSALPGFLNGETGVLPILKSAREELDRFKEALDNLVRSDPSIKNRLPFVSSYAALDTEISRGKDLIDGIVSWLEDPREHHVIVSFANTSELRPGGGFMGSFADLTIQDGSIKGIAVHDINDVDNAREQKVVPPQPLQAIAARWRTADANWFFDYPTSARKTLDFMEQSSLYGTATLDGLITVTPTVVKDILAVTGPVKTEDGTVVSADNFLDLIQKEVQAGQASGDPEPKAILGELVPILKSKLGELDASAQGKLAASAKKWIERKDLMLYMRDRKLSIPLAAYEADGALYPLPEDFSGDYLAVVDANIGGGKTDRFIRQKVSFEAHLDIGGTLRDEVTVFRQHDGARVEDWWYALTNWNYLQIFTPSGAMVESVSGGGWRDIGLRAEYRNGFESDADVLKLEKGLVMTEDRRLQVFKEADRNVFATWQKLRPGESKPFAISYSRVLPHPPLDGDEIVFVFESQSGADSALEVKIAAPPGFKWAEPDSISYEYKNDTPPGRLVTRLTLKKM